MHKVRVINVLSVSSQACNGQTHNTKSLCALVRNMLMVWGVRDKYTFNYFNSPSSSSFLPEEGTMSAVQYCGVDSGHDMKPFTFSCVKNDTSSPTCGFFYKKRNIYELRNFVYIFQIEENVCCLVQNI